MGLRLLLRSLVGIFVAFGVWQSLGQIIVISSAAGADQRIGLALASLLPAVPPV